MIIKRLTIVTDRTTYYLPNAEVDDDKFRMTSHFKGKSIYGGVLDTSLKELRRKEGKLNFHVRINNVTYI